MPCPYFPGDHLFHNINLSVIFVWPQQVDIPVLYDLDLS